MADKYVNDTGLSYFWSKIKSKFVPQTRKVNNKALSADIDLQYGDLVPIASKTFTDVIGTANSWAGATFFFGSIKPVSWTDVWRIRYRILTYVPGKAGYDQDADVVLSGSYGSLRSYASMNYVGPYYPAYYHVLYRLKEAGFNNDYGHSLGLRFYSAYSPVDTNYKRTIVIDVYETYNCTFEFHNTCLPYSSIPGTGSTNYDNYTEITYYSNGLYEAGDSDTTTQNRIGYTSRKAKTALYRYQICFTTMDNKILPANTVSNNTGTSKTLTTESFDPFGGIYYYNSSSDVAADGNIGNYLLYRQYLADMRYGFNVGAGSYFTARLPVYVKATPQSDGSAKLDTTTPLVQALPNSDDGCIYIYLGQAYEDTNPYRIELTLEHPVYYYHNGRIQLWTNGFSGSYNDLTNVPSSFTPSSHTHGDITNGGDITATATIASGDRLVINDESASKITNSSITFGSSATTFLANNGTWQSVSTTDTKNTAGATDTSSKIFLVGATTQGANPQTYSDDQVYATNGQLDMNTARIAETVTLTYNSTDKCLEFNFA